MKGERNIPRQIQLVVVGMSFEWICAYKWTRLPLINNIIIISVCHGARAAKDL